MVDLISDFKKERNQIIMWIPSEDFDYALMGGRAISRMAQVQNGFKSKKTRKILTFLGLYRLIDKNNY